MFTHQPETPTRPQLWRKKKRLPKAKPHLKNMLSPPKFRRSLRTSVWPAGRKPRFPPKTINKSTTTNQFTETLPHHNLSRNNCFPTCRHAGCVGYVPLHVLVTNFFETNYEIAKQITNAHPETYIYFLFTFVAVWPQTAVHDFLRNANSTNHVGDIAQRPARGNNGRACLEINLG